MNNVKDFNIISEENLVKELNNFRDILLNYDFSEVSNIIFFDINSLNHYLKTHKENPFERQYKLIEEKLDILFPYIPTSISEDTIEVLIEILSIKYDKKSLIKDNIIFNIKMDFIERVKKIKTDYEWNYLVSICKNIRNEKEKQLKKEKELK